MWEGHRKSAAAAVFTAKTYLSEWTLARTKHVGLCESLSGRISCMAWHPPPEGMLKLNVDAALFEDSFQTSIGMVLRSHDGEFIAARSMIFSLLLSPDEGEALGFFEALSWIKSWGLTNVIVEGDAKVVVDAIKSSSVNNSIFGDYVAASRSIIRSPILFY